MSNTLTKDIIPGTPGTFAVVITPFNASLGSPPTPPTPAYCVDIAHTTPSIQYGYVPGPDGNMMVIAYPGPPVTTYEHVCYNTPQPGTPGTPGVPPPNVPVPPGIPPLPPTPADYQAGWNGSARSIASLAGDGQYKFSVLHDSVGVVTGLNDANNGSSYQEIDYALHFSSGDFEVMEGGVSMGVSGSYTSTDIFAIVRKAGVVQYFQNSTLLYVSLKSSTGSVFADSSLYFGGDQIINASLSDTVDGGFPPPPASGNIVGAFGGLLGYFADTDHPQLQGVLSPLLGDLREGTARSGGLTGVLPALAGEFNRNDAIALQGVLPGMVGDFQSGLLQPVFTAADMTLQTLTSFFLGIGGVSAQLTGVLGGLRGFASNAPNEGGWMVDGTPPSSTDPVDPLTGDWLGRSGSQLRMLTGTLFDQDAVDRGSGTTLETNIILPSPLQVDAHIADSVSVVGSAVLPALQADGNFGLVFDSVLPALTLDAGFTFTNTLRADISLPLLLVSGTGTVGNVIGTREFYPLVLPVLRTLGKISSETDVQIVLPALQLKGRVVTDSHTVASIRLPSLHGGGNIITPLSIDPANPAGRRLQGHVLLPALRGDLNRLQADLVLPRLRVDGVIPVLLVDQAVQARVGYAMNLKTNAVTVFDNYPFKAMGRAHNKYWGVGLDGNLYQMGGDLDDTAPIAWEWRSGLADFGVAGQKGVLAVYIRGVFENGATVKFITDDALREYSHNPKGPYNSHKMHRVALGRGVRTDSMAFGMANLKGGYLELDKVIPEYVILARNL